MRECFEIISQKIILIKPSNACINPVYYFNNSGSKTTVTCSTVPNGGSVGSTNQSSAAVTGNNLGAPLTTLTIGSTMNSGDFIVLNTNSGTATQTAWVNVIEV